MTVINNNNNHR